jgi:hypothetical protein
MDRGIQEGMDRGIQEGKKIGPGDSRGKKDWQKIGCFFYFWHGQSGNLPGRFPLQESMSSNDGYNANMVVLHMSSSLKRRRDRGGASAIGMHYGNVSHQQVRRTGNGASHTENTALSRPKGAVYVYRVGEHSIIQKKKNGTQITGTKSVRGEDLSGTKN